MAYTYYLVPTFIYILFIIHINAQTTIIADPDIATETPTNASPDEPEPTQSVVPENTGI